VFKESESAVPVKTIKAAVVKGQRISPRDLSFSLSGFCGGFATYQAIQIDHQGLLPIRRNHINGKSTVVCKSSYVWFFWQVFRDVRTLFMEGGGGGNNGGPYV
jgi:hypothetical protein